MVTVSAAKFGPGSPAKSVWLFTSSDDLRPFSLHQRISSMMVCCSLGESAPPVVGRKLDLEAAAVEDGGTIAREERAGGERLRRILGRQGAALERCHVEDADAAGVVDVAVPGRDVGRRPGDGAIDVHVGFGRRQTLVREDEAVVAEVVREPAALVVVLRVRVGAAGRQRVRLGDGESRDRAAGDRARRVGGGIVALERGLDRDRDRLARCDDVIPAAGLARAVRPGGVGGRLLGLVGAAVGGGEQRALGGHVDRGIGGVGQREGAGADAGILGHLLRAGPAAGPGGGELGHEVVLVGAVVGRVRHVVVERVEADIAVGDQRGHHAGRDHLVHIQERAHHDRHGVRAGGLLVGVVGHGRTLRGGDPRKFSDCSFATLKVDRTATATSERESASMTMSLQRRRAVGASHAVRFIVIRKSRYGRTKKPFGISHSAARSATCAEPSSPAVRARLATKFPVHV